MKEILVTIVGVGYEDLEAEIGTPLNRMLSLGNKGYKKAFMSELELDFVGNVAYVFSEDISYDEYKHIINETDGGILRYICGVEHMPGEIVEDDGMFIINDTKYVIEK